VSDLVLRYPGWRIEDGYPLPLVGSAWEFSATLDGEAVLDNPSSSSPYFEAMPTGHCRFSGQSLARSLSVVRTLVAAMDWRITVSGVLSGPVRGSGMLWYETFEPEELPGSTQRGRVEAISVVQRVQEGLSGESGSVRYMDAGTFGEVGALSERQAYDAVFAIRLSV